MRDLCARPLLHGDVYLRRLPIFKLDQRAVPEVPGGASQGSLYFNLTDATGTGKAYVVK